MASAFAAYHAALDAYAERDGAAIVGEAQLAWLAGELLASKDAGVAWQVVAQASPTVDGASPDLEKGAAALDAAGETEGLPPPYRTWREALEAWTDWRGESSDGSGGSDSGGGANAGSEKTSVGRSGISPVPAASARAALALGKYRVNWNFDDWRGYAKERRRLYESVLPNARRAMVLGGDSHDAWAGTVSADARDWNPARGYDSSAHPRTPTGDDTVDRRSGADDRWAAVEFDVPGVTPPGAHERAFPWLPFELSDAGHLAANAPTMRFAKSGRRGFALVTFETGASKRATATFVATPEVREETYAAKCLGAFEAAADDGGGGGPTEPPGVFVRCRCGFGKLRVRRSRRRCRAATTRTSGGGSRERRSRVVVLRARVRRRHLRRRRGRVWVQLAVRARRRWRRRRRRRRRRVGAAEERGFADGRGAALPRVRAGGRRPRGGARGRRGGRGVRERRERREPREPRESAAEDGGVA